MSRSCAAPFGHQGVQITLTCKTFAQANDRQESHYKARSEPPPVEVVIEVPQGSFLKRGSTGKVDFISPLPCPFNYGSVPGYIGLDGDLLDAVVLGPRLPLGTKIRVRPWGAVVMRDRGLTDDKLICAEHSPDAAQRRKVLRFFHFYARCKGLLNIWRGRPGRNACEGWCDASDALARARPRNGSWRGPPLEF
ncbi:inorganic diphosphatase [Nitrosospira sp. Is2]|uniref:inorganic diphosphatase n=1 Tax=Nitrosospira sp. Is2 TaxID=3080532 RepID=UPI002955AF75|nr:inorganic diphosphatase [Nitrosospira sp. Is2]WON75204.1 inorganic diphosphatase [Nitrosospira sp. Is2]